MRVVFEVYVFKVYALILFFHRGFQSLLAILVIHSVNFVDAFKTNLYILHRIEETHQLFHGRVKLPYDVLHGKHHTKCKLSVDNGSGCHHGNDDIL